MTVKEAILTLNANAVVACERAGFSSATVKMIEDALDTIEDALKAQEPKPVYITAEFNRRKVGECPNCGKMINSGDYPNYCGRCGQAVKWE